MKTYYAPQYPPETYTNYEWLGGAWWRFQWERTFWYIAQFEGKWHE